MKYELAKELKEAGLSWNDDFPTLSELISACEVGLNILYHNSHEACAEKYSEEADEHLLQVWKDKDANSYKP